MKRSTLASVLALAVVGGTACGKSPAAPTTPSSSQLDPTVQATVSTTVSQVLSQTAGAGATLASGGTILTSGPSAFTFTFPCPGGGSVVTTMSAPVTTSDGPTTFSMKGTSQTEFNDCRSQDVVMRGDPALVHASDFLFQSSNAGAPTTMTSTIRTTGAVIAESHAVQTRVRFDCTSTITIDIGATSLPSPGPRPTLIATGTMTWESPLGTVVRTSGCGGAL